MRRLLSALVVLLGLAGAAQAQIVLPGGGGGTGTVTSVSVTTANGVSAVSNGDPVAPALTFTLGAITPTTVAIGGATIGSNALAVTGSGTFSTGLSAGYFQPTSASGIPGSGAVFGIDGSGAGAIYLNGSELIKVTGTNLQLNSTNIQISGTNTWLTGAGAASLNMGQSDAAAPVAQTLGVQSVVAGTTNAAGANRTETGSRSTGSGISGDIIFQTGGTGAGATAQNSLVSALVIKGATQLVQLPAITTDSGKTDATICEDTTTHSLYSGSGTLGICLGTSSIRYKHDVSELSEGLKTIMSLEPKRYYLNADHGDSAKPYYGFLAEDCAKEVPELTGLDAEGKPNTCDYLGLVPILVNAMKQQQVEIDHMKKAVK